MNIRGRAIFLLCPIFLLLIIPACAVQRAQDATTAQQRMVGMSREQVFTCMGIPKRKGVEGNTEIWFYKSGNDRTDRTKGTGSITTKRAVKQNTITDTLSAAVSGGDEVSEKRYCNIDIVIGDGVVKAVNYSGPTGGILTEDEQCAFATRNCLR